MRRVRRSLAVVALAAAVSLIVACTPGSGGTTPQPSSPAGAPAASVAPAPSASGGKPGY